MENNRKIARKMYILYFPSEAVFRKFMLTLKSKRENRIEPDAVYSLSYGIYLSGNAGDVTKMLLVPDWKKKIDIFLSKIMDATIVKGEKHDLISPSGVTVYNLLCCNIARVKKLRGLITKHESIVVIHPWMRNMIEEMYEGKPEILEIYDDTFKMMLTALT